MPRLSENNLRLVVGGAWKACGFLRKASRTVKASIHCTRGKSTHCKTTLQRYPVHPWKNACVLSRGYVRKVHGRPCFLGMYRLVCGWSRLSIEQKNMASILSPLPATLPTAARPDPCTPRTLNSPSHSSPHSTISSLPILPRLDVPVLVFLHSFPRPLEPLLPCIPRTRVLVMVVDIVHGAAHKSGKEPATIRGCNDSVPGVSTCKLRF